MGKIRAFVLFPVSCLKGLWSFGGGGFEWVTSGEV